MRETCVRRNRKVPPWLEQLVRAIRLPFGNGARPAVVTREIRAKCHPIDLELFTRVSFGDRKGGKSIYNFACAPIYFSTNYKFWSRVAGLCFLWVVACSCGFFVSLKELHLRAGIFTCGEDRPIYANCKVWIQFGVRGMIWKLGFPQKRSARSWEKMTKLSWTVKGNWYHRVENKFII
jgi:hypothetical protein